MDEWIINIMDKIGFSCYDVIDAEIIDLEDTFNLITSNGDIWLEKDYCYIKYTKGIIQSIEYNTESISILIERIDEGFIDKVA